MKTSSVNLLRRLLAEDSVRASDVGHAARAEIAPLLASGAIVQRRTGAGSRYHVADRAAVHGLLRRFRPEECADPDLPSRAAAVRESRNSKTAAPDAPEVLLLRAPQSRCEFRNDTDILDIGDLTRRFGVASLAIHPGDTWHTDRPMGLVENKEAFFHAERLPESDPCGCFLYYSGNPSDRLIHWLSARVRAPQLLLYPDYDPVGLGLYVKLRNRVGPTVRLIVPANIADLLAAYGKPDLLAKNTDRLPALRANGDGTVRHLVDLMQQHSAGLEQEVLLTSPSPDGTPPLP